MGTSTVITQAAQQAQGFATALDASLPELASTGRAALQELLAFLASGGQAIPGQALVSSAASTGVELAADAAIDAITPSLNPLDTNLTPSSSDLSLDRPLSTLRKQFGEELKRLVSHVDVAELPDRRRERSHHSWSVGSGSSLSDLAVPPRERKPFVKL